MHKPIIYSAVRSPRARAKSNGALHSVSPQELLSQLYRALQAKSGLDLTKVEEVILGCVTQQGEQAANIARSSVLYANLPEHIPGLTVHRFCSSGLDAIALAALKVQTGMMQCTIAGGVEMMSRVPMLSDGARIFTDADFAKQCRTLLMGSGADLIASIHEISRAEADNVAVLSQQRAAQAQAQGYFEPSIVPIETADSIAETDECIRPDTTMESLAALVPAFAALGASGVDTFQIENNGQVQEISHIHTPGNSPAMADAAGLLLIGSPEFTSSLAVKARAQVVASVTAAADPLQVLTGCIAATKALLNQTELSAADIDLFEIHEAFAATSVLAKRELALSDDKLNVNGGVIALGHPMGATGAIMAMTLLDELERRNLRRGVVAAAGAAGSGSAILIDRDISA